MWPNFYHFSLISNPDLGDEIVGEGLAKVIEEGRLPLLKKLRVDETGLTREGAERLLGAIETSRECPELKTVVMDEALLSDGDWKERFKGRGIELTRPQM